MRPWSPGEADVWNLDRLFGTLNSSINFTTASLATIDGDNTAEGGRISFTLNAPIAPTGLYLYVADSGGGNDGFRLKVSSEVTFPTPGLTLVGTSSDDVIDLSKGINEPVGRGNDLINGGIGTIRFLPELVTIA